VKVVRLLTAWCRVHDALGWVGGSERCTKEHGHTRGGCEPSRILTSGLRSPHRPRRSMASSWSPRRGGVKSDDIDAVRAARQALAGVGLSEPRSRGTGSYSGAADHPCAGNPIPHSGHFWLHAQVTSTPDGLRERLRTMPLGQLLYTCAGLRVSSRRSIEESAPSWPCGPPHAGRSPRSC
jgi:hypothetical protein